MVRNLERCWGAIGIIQVADNPGRLEFGTGGLNWPTILRVLRDRGHASLVELEHRVSRLGAGDERDVRNSCAPSTRRSERGSPGSVSGINHEHPAISINAPAGPAPLLAPAAEADRLFGPGGERQQSEDC